MQEHDRAAPADDGGHQGSYTTPDQATVASNVNASPAQDISTRSRRALNDAPHTRAWLSSPVMWLLMATLLAALLVYLFVVTISDAVEEPTENVLEPAR